MTPQDEKVQKFNDAIFEAAEKIFEPGVQNATNIFSVLILNALQIASISNNLNGPESLKLLNKVAKKIIQARPENFQKKKQLLQ